MQRNSIPEAINRSSQNSLQCNRSTENSLRRHQQQNNDAKESADEWPIQLSNVRINRSNPAKRKWKSFPSIHASKCQAISVDDDHEIQQLTVNTDRQTSADQDGNIKHSEVPKFDKPTEMLQCFSDFHDPEHSQTKRQVSAESLAIALKSTIEYTFHVLNECVPDLVCKHGAYNVAAATAGDFHRIVLPNLEDVLNLLRQRQQRQH
jgi:hypothetical protein